MSLLQFDEVCFFISKNASSLYFYLAKPSENLGISTILEWREGGKTFVVVSPFIYDALFKLVEF